MTRAPEHRRSYALGYGYTVEFVFSSAAEGLRCEWSPAVPKIGGRGARERFLAAYRAARGDFLQDVAQMLGGNVAAIDLDEHGHPDGLTAYMPQAAH